MGISPSESGGAPLPPRLDTSTAHSARVWNYLLGDLVGVVGRGQAGADVEELPDPGLAGQVAHRPAEEPALQPGDMGDAREHLQDHVADLAVGREVVLAA